MTVSFADLILRAEKQLGLPHLATGRATESLSLLCGVGYALPDLIPEGFFCEADKAVEAYAIRPRIKDSPFGFLFSHCVLADPTTTFRHAQVVGLKQALTPEAYCPAFREFSGHVLKQAKLIVKSNPSDFTDRKALRDVIEGRLRELWRLFEATDLTGISFAQKLESARTNVEAQYNEKSINTKNRDRITPVFEHDKPGAKRRRDRTVWDRLIALGRNEERIRNALGRAERVESDDEETGPRPLSPEVRSKASRYFGGRYMRSHAWQYACGTPVAGQLGRAEVALVLTEVAKMKKDEDVALAMVFFGFVPPNLLKTCEVYARPTWRVPEKGRHWDPARMSFVSYVMTPARFLQKAPSCPYLYRPVHEWLERPIPSILFRRFEELRKKPDFDEITRRVDGHLATIFPGATTAKVMQALILHGESWFQLPSIFVESALRPTRRKWPAYLSYTCISWPMIARVLPFQKILDPGFEHYFPDIEQVGSRLCPRKEVVRTIFKNWKRYLRVRYLKSTERGLMHWNIVVAGLHLITLLVLGLRNNPMDGLPLDVALPISDWGLIYQKGEPVAYYVPPFLRMFFQLVRGILQSLKKRLRSESVSINRDQSEVFAYGFLDWDGADGDNLQVTYAFPRHRLVVEGMLMARGLERFADLDRKWPRHFSNTILREHGFRELQVRNIHWHHEGMLHGFRRHRAEDLLSRAMLLSMQEVLAQEAGIL